MSSQQKMQSTQQQMEMDITFVIFWNGFPWSLSQVLPYIYVSANYPILLCDLNAKYTLFKENTEERYRQHQAGHEYRLLYPCLSSYKFMWSTCAKEETWDRTVVNQQHFVQKVISHCYVVIQRQPSRKSAFSLSILHVADGQSTPWILVCTWQSFLLDL